MSRSRAVTAALLLLACLAFVVHARVYRDWVEDDAAISFRYARNLADGEGMAYNPGERVEGYSNTAWVLLAATVLKAGGDPLPVAQACGVLGGLVCLLVAWRLALHLAPDHPGAALLAPWFLALTPVLPRHAVSGLETDAFAAALGVAVLVAVGPVGGRSRTPRRVLLVAALVLAALLRPEGTPLALLGLAVAWRGGRVDRRDIAAVLVLLAAYHGWRLAWFGSLLPNTYYAKLTGGAAALRPGLNHVLDFVRETGGAALVGFSAALLLDDRVRWRLVALLTFVAVLVGMVIAAGGDWMHHYRLLAPALPLLAAALAAGAGWAAGGAARATGHRLLARLVVGAALATALMNTAKTERAVAQEVMPSVRAGGYLTQSYRRLGAWLRDHTAPDAVVAASDIGEIGYVSGRRLVDMLGLVDPHIARRPGILHAKFDAEHVLARRPDVVVLVEKRRQGGRVIHRRLADAALAALPGFRAEYERVHTEPIAYMDETAVVYFRRAP